MSSLQLRRSRANADSPYTTGFSILNGWYWDHVQFLAKELNVFYYDTLMNHVTREYSPQLPHVRWTERRLKSMAAVDVWIEKAVKESNFTNGRQRPLVVLLVTDNPVGDGGGSGLSSREKAALAMYRDIHDCARFGEVEDSAESADLRIMKGGEE